MLYQVALHGKAHEAQQVLGDLPDGVLLLLGTRAKAAATTAENRAGSRQLESHVHLHADCPPIVRRQTQTGRRTVGRSEPGMNTKRVPQPFPRCLLHLAGSPLPALVPVTYFPWATSPYEGVCRVSFAVQRDGRTGGVTPLPTRGTDRHAGATGFTRFRRMADHALATFGHAAVLL